MNPVTQMYVGITSALSNNYNRMNTALTNQRTKFENSLRSRNGRRTVKTAIAGSLVGVVMGLVSLYHPPSEFELSMKSKYQLNKPGEVAELKYKTNDEVKDVITNHKRTYSLITWGSAVVLSSSLALYRRKKKNKFGESIDENEAFKRLQEMDGTCSGIKYRQKN